ncbi:MAG: DUF1836 domain-containing protein [Lachnospiraceae bacterium]|nr:DUF1836 domain-containing protein [Lachnospiraceae bacterium]
MTLNMDDLINSIMASLDRIDYIKPEDIPNIDLYMDQVTTFMDKKLRNTSRSSEDKILTKTMINNYAKNNLLPPPVKKKYSREHILLLIFIYYYKGILSISDIQSLLNPLTERFFGTDESFNLEEIYHEVFSLEHDQVKALQKDILKTYEESKHTFHDVPEDSAEFLQMFSFICMLSFDVYVKKLLIEKIVDGFNQKQSSEQNTEKKNK